MASTPTDKGKFKSATADGADAIRARRTVRAQVAAALRARARTVDRATETMVKFLAKERLVPGQARTGVKKLLKEVIEEVARSTDTPKPSGVLVVQINNGKVDVVPRSRLSVRETKQQSKAQPADPQRLDQHLSNIELSDDTLLHMARIRGQETVAKILAGPEMLTGSRFAQMLGMSRMAIHKKLKNHQLLGLEGAKRGILYPQWQINDDGRPVAGLAEVLVKFGDDTWGAYRFLLQSHAGLGKRAAIDALKSGKKAKVLEAAETHLSGDFS